MIQVRVLLVQAMELLLLKEKGYVAASGHADTLAIVVGMDQKCFVLSREFDMLKYLII